MRHRSPHPDLENDSAANGQSRAAVLDRALFVVSIDTEMAWGKIHRPEEAMALVDERPHIERLLDLMDRFAIPSTFAIVGHLFLSECRAEAHGKHPEIMRPDYEWHSGDWFDLDPCSTQDAAPCWYGRDLVENIMQRPTPHEIASHSFSHIIVGDPGCSRAAFDSDLRACHTVAAELGIELRSFVYPTNSIGHLDVLSEQGFVSYRGRRPTLFADAPGTMVRTALRRLDSMMPSRSTVVRPLREPNGLWNLPATCMYSVADKGARYRLWLRQVVRRLHQAERHVGMFHIWFHPYNLADDPERAFDGLEKLFTVAADIRDAGRIDTLTMADVAARCSQRVPATT